MPRVANTLTDVEVKALTNPGHHPVGGVPGLLLQIRPSGSRYWVYRTHIAGKRCNIGIGSSGEYTLARALQQRQATQFAGLFATGCVRQTGGLI
jgi:hypothetical protein